MKISPLRKKKRKKSTHKKTYNFFASPVVIESVFVLVKLTICLLLLPLIHFCRIKGVKGATLENFNKAFLNSETFKKHVFGTLSKTLVDHPIAVSYLSEDSFKIQ